MTDNHQENSFLTESNLSSWCKNWAISSGVVPSIPCSCRYWIPLFGFLLNLYNEKQDEIRVNPLTHAQSCTSLSKKRNQKFQTRCWKIYILNIFPLSNCTLDRNEPYPFTLALMKKKIFHKDSKNWKKQLCCWFLS